MIFNVTSNFQKDEVLLEIFVYPGASEILNIGLTSCVKVSFLLYNTYKRGIMWKKEQRDWIDILQVSFH